MERILIVEDERSLLIFLALCLERKGYRVDTSETAPEALAKILANQYDYLITDIEIPRMNGYILADTAFRICPSTKIILMSAYSFPSGYRKYPYLTKPFEVSELLRTIEQYAGRRINSTVQRTV